MSGRPVIFVIDDDLAWCRALERLLRTVPYEVRAFCSGEVFLNEHDPQLDGCIILDMALPEMDGLEVQRRLAATGCQRPIIFISAWGTIPTAVRAIRAGALNFLTKPVDEHQLLHTIEEALKVDFAQHRVSAARSAIASRFAALTPREREVFGHIVAGRLNKQIAGALGTVEKTIKVHRARVMRKLGVRSLAALVKLAALASDPITNLEA